MTTCWSSSTYLETKLKLECESISSDVAGVFIFFYFLQAAVALRGVHVLVHVPPISLLPDSVSPPLAPCRLCVFLGRRKEAARG